MDRDFRLAAWTFAQRYGERFRANLGYTDDFWAVDV